MADTVIRGVTYRNAPPCPWCGGKVIVTEATVTDTYAPGYHVRGRTLPTRDREIVAAACTGCEWIEEVRA